jgi:hypothetical protein
MLHNAVRILITVHLVGTINWIPSFKIHTMDNFKITDVTSHITCSW